MSTFNKRRARVQELPLTISEKDFQSTVTGCAELFRWKWVHYFPLPNKRGRYQTPTEGHVGCPDIILARNGVVLLVELKRHGGKVAPAQRAWLSEAGEHGRLWTPTDWNTGQIYRELRHLGRPVGLR